jgi:hypothetical protein
MESQPYLPRLISVVTVYCVHLQYYIFNLSWKICKLATEQLPSITHCTENPIYVFPEMKLRGLASNSYIHVSVSDLNIPRIGLPI